MKNCRILIFFFFTYLNTTKAQQRPLDYFIDQAVANSPLIRDFQNQVKINQLDSLLILAGQRTQVSFISNDSYAPVFGSFGYDKAITNGANVNADEILRQVLGFSDAQVADIHESGALEPPRKQAAE